MAELEEKVRRLEVQNKNLERDLKEADQIQQKTQDSKVEVERRNESLRREIDMLTQDKGYLKRDT